MNTSQQTRGTRRPRRIFINPKIVQQKKDLARILNFHFREINELLKSYPIDPTDKNSRPRTVKYCLDSALTFHLERTERHIPLQEFYVEKSFGSYICAIVCPKESLLRFGPVHNKKLYFVGIRKVANLRQSGGSFIKIPQVNEMFTFEEALHQIDSLVGNDYYDEKLKQMHNSEIYVSTDKATKSISVRIDCIDKKLIAVVIVSDVENFGLRGC